MCDITAEMPDTMDGILYQARNFRLSSGTGAAYLVQLLKHLPISIEVCNATACTSRTWSPCSTPQANTDLHKVSQQVLPFRAFRTGGLLPESAAFFVGLIPEKKVHLGSPWNAAWKESR